MGIILCWQTCVPLIDLIRVNNLPSINLHFLRSANGRKFEVRTTTNFSTILVSPTRYLCERYLFWRAFSPVYTFYIIKVTYGSRRGWLWQWNRFNARQQQRRNSREKAWLQPMLAATWRWCEYETVFCVVFQRFLACSAILSRISNECGMLSAIFPLRGRESMAPS